MNKFKMPKLGKPDFTNPTQGSLLVAIFLTFCVVLFPEYYNLTLAIPAYYLIVGVLAILFIPVAFIKYYYIPVNKFVPELQLFIAARKQQFPLVQTWDSTGYFEFQKADQEELKKLNLSRSYTIRGLEIYQKLIMKAKKSAYIEAYQNISTSFAVTDIQSFRQIIEILKKNKSDYILKLIILCAIAGFILLIGLAVFLKMSGKV